MSSRFLSAAIQHFTYTGESSLHAINEFPPGECPA
jgi:hypothetical protein